MGRSTPAAAQPGATPASAGLPDNWLRAILAEGDNAPDRARMGQAGYIHVSSLIGFCSRQHAVLRLHVDQPVIRSVTGGHRVMWRLGRAAEEHVRDSIIKARRSQVMGEWSCVCGETKHRGYMPDRSCTRCGKRVNRYGEMAVFDTEAKIVGNPDLLLREEGLLVPVEVKSINKKDWEALTAPKGDHVFQVVAYARMLKALNYRMHQHAVIVYVCKDFVFGAPYKEFHVEIDAPHLVAQWEAARQAAMAAHAAVESGVLPPRVLCTSPDSTLAKGCPCMAQCFLRE
jgi:hypothetical protein